MHLQVCFTPQDYLGLTFSAPHTVVVLDVLRATTAITTAFANDCGSFIPVATVEEALAKKEQYPEALLAGERQALRIPGFDLGNSPFEYTREVVADKTIIMSTTNGTVALHTTARAAKVYVGAMVNAAALCSRLITEAQDVVLVCAGTQGRFSLEDTLCAGLFSELLTGKAQMGDTTLASRALFREFSRRDMVQQVLESSHAAYLASLGFSRDVEYCLQVSLLSVVPEYGQGVIRLVS